MAGSGNEHKDSGQWFATTHWSLVGAAGESQSPDGRRALEKLCGIYWAPLYGYIRRFGYSVHDAQDLTQGFLAWLLDSNHIRVADPERGRFRSFLLVRLKHYLSDEHKKRSAQKRGGGQAVISLDEVSREDSALAGHSPDLSHERVFDRSWAMAVLTRSVERLRSEYAAAGSGTLFEELRQFQSLEGAAASYREVAARLGLTEGAVKSAIFRFRRRHAALLREEIAQTVSRQTDIDLELRYLIEVLGDA